MPKKAKWEDFVQTKEYKLWSRLKDMAEYLQISGDNYITTQDIGGVFWEPFFVILFKFGNTMKLTGKLKEIKMDWMRPLGYLGSQSDSHVKYDGRDFLLDKGAIGNASNLRFAFQHVLDSIVSFDKLDEANFQAQFKEFMKQARDYFKYLNVFVKDGFRPMHENLKDILGPLRSLRKAGYRLFNLEQLEAKNEDLTMFQSKKDLGRFTNTIKRFFQSEEYKLKRDSNIDDFDQFLGSATVQEYYSFKFNNKTRDDNSNNETNSNSIKDDNKKSKEKRQFTAEELQFFKEEEQRQLLLNININDLIQQQANRFHKDALQSKFEEGLDAMYKYLNDKEPHRFPFTIESHKMFVNLKKIPNGFSNPSINYYLSQLINLINELKLKLFEMKLNGLSRVLIPITKNEDLTNHLKSIYDAHNIIDRVIGDYLLYDQYILMHQSVQFILNSNLHEELEVLKRKEFMEDSLPKFVFFQSMRHSVKIMRKMIATSRNGGKYFNIEDYHQISKHVIDGENNIVYYAYELTDSIKKFLSEASNETNKILQKEINTYGRFWLLEGFFPPKDRGLWIEAIEILNNINELVQEDMRDMQLLLHDKDKAKEEVRLDTKVSEDSQHKNNSTSQAHQRRQSKLMKGGKPLIKITSQKRKRKTSLASEDESGMKIPAKLDGLRPPYVWNFPVLEIEIKKRESLIREGKEQPRVDIRKADPMKCYKDQRVEKFMSIFNIIVENALEFCKQDKGNKWNYFVDMVLKVYHITYERNSIKY